jgi:hypothetical protein
MKRPSAALVVASLALFVSLCGTGIAASHYLITSTRQISPRVLRALRQVGPRGATGPAGPAGTAGTAGITSIKYVTATTQSDAAFYPGGGIAEMAASAVCPPGYVAIGGAGTPNVGLSFYNQYPASVQSGTGSDSISAAGYTAQIDIPADRSAGAFTVQATAVCASGPGIQVLP